MQFVGCGKPAPPHKSLKWFNRSGICGTDQIQPQFAIKNGDVPVSTGVWRQE